ncbi:MAG: pilus assembly protein N-terminal domain-containing protein [Pseudomonadota bacterium]
MTRIAIALAVFFAAAPAFAQSVTITLDEAKILHFNEPASSIIVGNPAVADITVQDDRNALLFGKAPGVTNILILDTDGKEVQNIRVQVSGPTVGLVVVQRGLLASTYTCTTRCVPTPQIGDNPESFQQATQQIATRLQSAVSAAEAGAATDTGGDF